MPSTHADLESAQLAQGSWRVDPNGRLAFTVRTMWGLVPVRGEFSSFEGELDVDAAGVASGELTIRADSLDTKNKKRDQHLRSSDFFNTDAVPSISFSSTAIAQRADGLHVAGELKIAGSTVQLQLPVDVKHVDETTIRLSTATSVTRQQVGLTWNKAGMIRGDALLDIAITLHRAD